MIRLLEHKPPAWDLFSARVLANSCCAADGTFFVQNNEAVLSFFGCNALLAAKEHADWAELVAFLRIKDWSRLECTAASAAHLPFHKSEQGCIVRFSGTQTAPPLGFSYEFSNDVLEIWGILTNSGFQCLLPRDLWLADMAARWRCGVSKSWVGRLNGTPCCTATVMLHRDGFSHLGAVATLPAFRGCGAAGALVNALAQRCSVDSTVHLCCRQALLGFYEKIGFVHIDEWVAMQKEMV